MDEQAKELLRHFVTLAEDALKKLPKEQAKDADAYKQAIAVFKKLAKLAEETRADRLLNLFPASSSQPQAIEKIEELSKTKHPSDGPPNSTVKDKNKAKTKEKVDKPAPVVREQSAIEKIAELSKTKHPSDGPPSSTAKDKKKAKTKEKVDKPAPVICEQSVTSQIANGCSNVTTNQSGGSDIRLIKMLKEKVTQDDAV